MAQQLQGFTIRMMQGVVDAHATRTEHDHYCCKLAAEYAARLRPETLPAPRTSPRPPAPSKKNEGRPLTEPMAKYLRGLRRQISLELLSPRHRELLALVMKGEEILFEDARQMIEAMKSLADKSISSRYVEPAYIPEEGPYQVGDAVYLVVTGRETNRRYAKKFNTKSGKFEYYGQSPFSMLTADRRMTAEQAKVFGDLHCTCCNCGKRLTKQISKDYGYGPVCADKNGWPY